MDKNFYDKKTEIFKALANPMRLQIIDLLLNGEKCVCEIVKELNYEQSHISKGLVKLKSVHLIKDRKDGLNVYYSLNCDCMKDFFNCLNGII
ncbi:MAG: metalloregulator ArsR/SmtB family transcription factor [Clostridiaceae bacterium]|nr:metalloregulator ArsR/SmtB family transcription factor [Clostridiaceae bacterium]